MKFLNSLSTLSPPVSISVIILLFLSFKEKLYFLILPPVRTKDLSFK